MNIITSVMPLEYTIDESAGSLKIQGIFQKAETRNENGRWYSRAILEREQKIVDELQEIYTDDDLQEVREDFDVFIDKQFQQLSQEASLSNASAKYIQNELEANSFAEFGVGIEELYNYIPDDVEGAQMRDAILTSYQASKDVQQLAADKYEVGQTFLDGKFDEELRGEIVENYAGMQQQITEGLNRGKAGNEILKIALGLEDSDQDSHTINYINLPKKVTDNQELKDKLTGE